MPIRTFFPIYEQREACRDPEEPIINIARIIVQGFGPSITFDSGSHRNVDIGLSQREHGAVIDGIDSLEGISVVVGAPASSPYPGFANPVVAGL